MDTCLKCGAALKGQLLKKGKEKCGHCGTVNIVSPYSLDPSGYQRAEAPHKSGPSCSPQTGPTFLGSGPY